MKYDWSRRLSGSLRFRLMKASSVSTVEGLFAKDKLLLLYSHLWVVNHDNKAPLNMSIPLLDYQIEQDSDQSPLFG